MVSFAVWHEGMDEGKGTWVLAVDGVVGGGAFLLHDEKDGFYWMPMAQCKLVRVHTPDNPSPVVAIPAQPQNGLTVPGVIRNGGKF